MAIVDEGADIGEIDWDAWLVKYLAALAAAEETSSTGASVQQSGNFGQSVSMIDQIVGKVGPVIGKWDPESGSRAIQEF